MQIYLEKNEKKKKIKFLKKFNQKLKAKNVFETSGHLWPKKEKI